VWSKLSGADRPLDYTAHTVLANELSWNLDHLLSRTLFLCGHRGTLRQSVMQGDSAIGAGDVGDWRTVLRAADSLHLSPE
jgi:hypothetical protein